MATWKKVIVSGSSAVLSNLALDTALPVGSGGTGASSLTDGGVLLGSGTGAITALGQATNGQLVIGSTGADPVLGTLTGGANILITSGSGTISIAAAGLGSGTVQTVSATGTENGLTLTSDGNTVNPVITLGGTLTGVQNSQLSNDAITIAGTSVQLGGSITADTIAGQISATTITNGQLVNDGITIAGNDISLGGSITAATILAGTNVVSGSSDGVLSQGNGISAFSFDGSGNATVAVAADSTTGGNVKPISVTGNGVGFDISTIDGNGISVSGQQLIVQNADGTITVGSGGIGVADGGIGTTQLADGAVTTAKIATSLGTLSANQFTGSFSGSFVGDGSGLSGLVSSLTIDSDGGGTQDVNLLTDDLQIIGTTDEIVTAVTKVGNDVKLQIGLPDAVTITTDLTVGNDLTVTRDSAFGRDVVITRNLTVQGTASFQSTEDLDVKDRFIRLASGSNSAGDGGIVVQQTGPADGEVFGFDAIKLRWGVSGSFDASQNSFIPDAFMAQVLEGAGNVPSEAVTRYVKKGNIFVGANEDIYIYS
mgnify:CR=1 FL=1